MKVWHEIFGTGEVIARRQTESGNTVCDIDFSDCSRTILLSVLQICEDDAPIKLKGRPKAKTIATGLLKTEKRTETICDQLLVPDLDETRRRISRRRDIDDECGTELQALSGF